MLGGCIFDVSAKSLFVTECRNARREADKAFAVQRPDPARTWHSGTLQQMTYLNIGANVFLLAKVH